MANPNCPDKGSAERAVNEVWESCFNDTRPFDEVCIAYFLTCSPFFTQNSRYINTLAHVYMLLLLSGTSADWSSTSLCISH